MKKFFIKLFSKTPTVETEELDGGVINRTNSKAPKTINCTALVDFYCDFSVVDQIDEDYGGNTSFYLSAKRADGVTKGSYQASAGKRINFTAPADFMDKLQSIISEYELAYHNGINVHVNGLPDMYGAELMALYESGESIFAANNQDNFLPNGAARGFIALFESQLQ